ncbi:MAG: WD40 repeat domain-containing protein, partial [Trebonia sp.]|uniref:WD40 repeat domain-containing protein n=3 Tax=Trebonia sp. TaxID=2767075 RepID=UPI003C752674
GAGLLPLLSYALDQAWRTHRGLTLTLADYERTGGIEGAVAASAQRAFGQLTAAQRETARQVFTRLIATGDDGTDTPVSVARADLSAGRDGQQARDLDDVLETFAAERLLILDDGSVDISHEALLTAWPQLRDWLADTHADRVVRTGLEVTARDWERAGRDPAYLYGGSRLEAAREAAAKIGADARYTPLSGSGNEFLRASGTASRRRARRRQALLAALLALATALAAVAVAAFHASQESSRERDVAFSGELAADSLALADTNITAAGLQSIVAWSLDRSSDQARYAVLNAAASPEIATLPGGYGGVYAVAFAPGGQILATGAANGTARLWSLATGRPIGPALRGGAGGIDSVAFGRGGKTLVTGAADGSTRIWDLATDREVGRPILTSDGSGIPESVSVSPDGTMLAVADGEPLSPAQLWDAATGRRIGAGFGGQPASVPFNEASVSTVDEVSISPDGKLLATAGWDGSDGSVQLWDVTTGRKAGGPLIAGQGTPTSVVFSPDGTTLAAAGPQDPVRLWNVATGRQIGHGLATGGESGHIISIAFSPGGKVLATGGDNGYVQLWNVATGQQMGSTADVSSGLVDSVAFSPDGTILATGDSGGGARLWDVSAIEQASRAVSNPRYDSVAVAVSPDGKTLATDDGNGSVRLWDIATGRQVGPVLTVTAGVPPSRPAPPGSSASLAFSPDGKILAAGEPFGGIVRLWSVATGRPVGPGLNTNPQAPEISSLAFSPDGKILATAANGGQAELWDVATGHQIGTPFAHDAFSVAFSPDGRILAVADIQSSTVRLWNIAAKRQAGGPLAAGIGPADSGDLSELAFSPKGDTLAAIDADGSVRLWDAADRRALGNPLNAAAGAAIQSVAFSPDGRTLATADSGGDVRLWDVDTSQEIGAALAVSPGVTELAFTPDGKTLVAGSDSGPAQAFNVGYLTQPLASVCARPGDSITPGTWAEYAPPGPAYRQACPAG